MRADDGTRSLYVVPRRRGREHEDRFSGVLVICLCVFDEKINIGDRSILAAIRERGHIELRELEFQNNLFRERCNEYYKSCNAAELYTSMNESYWM